MTCRVAVQEEVLVATVVFLCSSSNYLFIAQSICVPIVVKRLSSDLFTHLCLHAVQTNSGQNDLLRSCPGRSHSCKSCFSHGSSSIFCFCKASAQTLVPSCQCRSRMRLQCNNTFLLISRKCSAVVGKRSCCQIVVCFWGGSRFLSVQNSPVPYTHTNINNV